MIHFTVSLDHDQFAFAPEPAVITKTYVPYAAWLLNVSAHAPVFVIVCVCPLFQLIAKLVPLFPAPNPVGT